MILLTKDGIRKFAGPITLGLALFLTACQSAEDRIETYFDNGQALLEEEEFVKAELEFRNVLQIDEDHVGALYGLSKVRENAQKWRDVAGLLQKIIDLDTTHVAAREDFCRLLFLANEMAKATEECAAAEKLAPERASIYALQSALALRGGDTVRSASLANKALKLDENNVEAVLVLASHQFRAGNIKMAMEIVERGLAIDEKNVGLLLFKVQIYDREKDQGKAVGVFRDMIRFYPDNNGFRTTLVRYLLATDRKDEAEVEIRAIAALDPGDTKAAIDVVRFLASTKNAEAAEEELRGLVKRFPDKHEYGLALASALWQRGDKDEARSLVQGVIEAGSEEGVPLARLQMARMLVGDKNFAEARALIGEVLEADSKNVTALAMRASLRMNAGELDEAISDFRTALSEQPNALEVILPLARAHEMAGSAELAQERYAAGASIGNYQPRAARPYVDYLLRQGKPARAEEILDQILAQAPRDIPTLTRLAELRLNRQDWAGTQEIADRLQEIDQEGVLSQQILAEAMAGQSKFDESIVLLEKTVKAKPNAIQPMVSLVRTFLRADRRDAAIELLQSVGDADPRKFRALLMLASLFEQDARAEDANGYIRKAIELAPDNPVGYQALIGFWNRSDSTEKAAEALSEGLARVPDDFNLLMLKATADETAGRIDDAIAVYERLNTLRPNAIVVLNNLASLLADFRTDEESLGKAEKMARRLTSIDVPQFKDTLAWVHFKRGRNAPAIALLKEAISSPSPLPIYYYHLGLIYASANDIDNARENLTTALELAEKIPFVLADSARKALVDLDKITPKSN